MKNKIVRSLALLFLFTTLCELVDAQPPPPPGCGRWCSESDGKGWDRRSYPRHVWIDERCEFDSNDYLPRLEWKSMATLWPFGFLSCCCTHDI
jgi:hypothetical protein